MVQYERISYPKFHSTAADARTNGSLCSFKHSITCVVFVVARNNVRGGAGWQRLTSAEGGLDLTRGPAAPGCKLRWKPSPDRGVPLPATMETQRSG